jgi:hypothetical protein
VAILKKTTAFDFNMSISGPIKKITRRRRREKGFISREKEKPNYNIECDKT